MSVDPLSGSMADYVSAEGPNLLERIQPFFKWQESRRRVGLWPYSKAIHAAPRTHCTISDDSGIQHTGLNFASQDYLSLSSHPKIQHAAISAINTFGVHSAGSGALLGNTSLSVRLEKAVGDKLQMNHVVLYPTGWGAGFGVIRGMVRSHDHVVMDSLSHACLQAGAMASVPKVRKFRHNDAEHLAHVLGRHRLCNAENAILVVTEGLFSMDSDSPDISKTQAICRNYDATLVVDVAHDFGCLGPGGTGMIGAQGMLGKVDLVMGSFSKTFATNGGFVATNSRAVSEYLRFYSSPTTFSNALSPSQAAVVLEALRIIDSPEGEDRRRRLMNAIMKLRTELLNHGISANGIPSPIVPIISGREDLSRIAARNLLGAGCLANLVEFPAVKKGAARFRFQVQSDHTDEDASQAARSLAEALAAAKASLSVSMVEEARGRVVEFSVPDEDFTLSKPVLPTWADSYTAGCKILG